MIGRIQAKYGSLKQCEDGTYDLSFNIAHASQGNVRRIVDDIKAVIAAGQAEIVLTIEKITNKRSLAQNRLLWALLEKMAEHLDSGRTGGITAWDCYINMLERFGGKYQYFMCVPDALGDLKKEFRAVKEVERRDYNGVEMVVCKCFIGSSKYNSNEMTLLIEGVLDVLAELGVKDTIMCYYYEEYAKIKK